MLDGLEKRELGKIYFCWELNESLRCFSAAPSAFELPLIEQLHIFPRSEHFFQVGLFLKKELLK